jgi:hypothetical protein
VEWGVCNGVRKQSAPCWRTGNKRRPWKNQRPRLWRPGWRP